MVLHLLTVVNISFFLTLTSSAYSLYVQRVTVARDYTQ
jgi:hypothetical protein